MLCKDATWWIELHTCTMRTRRITQKGITKNVLRTYKTTQTEIITRNLLNETQTSITNIEMNVFRLYIYI